MDKQRYIFEKNTFIPHYIELKHGKYSVKAGEPAPIYDFASVLNNSFTSWQAATKQSESEIGLIQHELDSVTSAFTESQDLINDLGQVGRNRKSQIESLQAEIEQLKNLNYQLDA